MVIAPTMIIATRKLNIPMTLMLPSAVAEGKMYIVT